MDEVTIDSLSLDGKAVLAQQLREEADSLITEFMPFLNSRARKYAARISREEHQDELLSIAMQAFHEAIQNYDVNKGHFYPFANRVVSDRCIDYLRRIYRIKIETVPLDENSEEPKSAQSAALRTLSYRAHDAAQFREALVEEIEQYKAELSTWGITMESLSQHSPKQKRLLEDCKSAVLKICQTPDIVQTIQIKRYFPIKAVAALTGLPHKTCERVRIFLLASVIIKMGDYTYLSEYVNYGR
ncbi:MAG: hypothetical protein FWF06_07360 [Symbiobacteriaceae bacterium]|nr:hypothetical protein [Symbiobacteriaceae bacterium]